jgi:hypothetical protein
MTFSVLTNIATMILCIAVLIQTVRLMRALDAVKGGVLTDVVTALDTSTNQARQVLGNLTALLRCDVAETTRTLSDGKAMIEELAVMTGIANAVAERIVDAADVGKRDRIPAVAAPARKRDRSAAAAPAAKTSDAAAPVPAALT